MAFPFDITPAHGGGLLRFRNADDVFKLLDRMHVGWNWLGVAANRENNRYSRNSEAVNAWNALNQTVSNIRSNLTGGNPESAESFLRNYLERADSLPLPETISGSLIAKVLEDVGDRGALGALAAIRHERFDGDNADQVRGVTMAHELLSGTGKTARQSVQAGLAGLVARFAEQQQLVEDWADDLARRVATTELSGRQRLSRLLKAGVRARRRFTRRTNAHMDHLLQASTERVDQIETRSNEAIARIDHTDEVYKQHMALKGPVTYWQGKARQHRTAALIACLVGLAFAATVVTYIYWDGAYRLMDLVKATVKETHLWQVAYVALTVAAFLLAIAFWIGRLISRTYVSQSHLALDAEERATMVQTYLALANDDKVAEGDRGFVLASLFRSSSDGLVRDDGAPDLSLAGVVSRLAAGPAGGGKS